MKKSISISLLILFAVQAVLPNMDICCELPKLPDLIVHFDSHKKTEGDNLMKFVSEHLLQLGAINHEHENGSEHDDLPFHGSHHCAHAPLVFVTSASEEVSITVHYLSLQYGTFVSPAPKGYSESPFQPPKG